MLQNITNYLTSIDPIGAALLAGVFTWLMTGIGASIIFIINTANRKILDMMLGFTGGVMIAACFWSLLAPAISMSPGEEFFKVIPVAVGFGLGALFLFGMDKILPHFHSNLKETEGVKTPLQRSTLMVLAITLHNIPEGLAIGVLFGGVAAGIPEATILGAITLAIGIGVQNLPEGLAVALPLRRLGLSRTKSFAYGQASAIVEPIAAFLGAWAIGTVSPLLPYALAFAAGAMIFVVVEEVIPESQQGNNTDLSTLGFIIGFIVMMSLDVGLG